MLTQLNSITSEQDPAKRRELLSAVADLFLLKPEEHSDRKNERFQTVMEHLLNQVDDAGKVEFAHKIAPSEYTSADIAERLARDDSAAVAGPVLRHSPVLSDDVLVDIAQVKSQDHMKAISSRETVSEKVTDVLVERGDEDVVRTVASNAGASFSEKGFTRIAEKSHSDAVLASSLFARTDIPKDVAVKLIEDMPAHLRQKLDGIASQNVLAASKLVQQAAKVAGAEDTKEDPYATSKARELFTAVRSGRMSVDTMVVQLAEANRPRDLVTMMSKLSGLPAAEIEASMGKTDMSAIAVVCKELRVTKVGFEALATMIGGMLKLPASHVDHFVGQYDALNIDVAERVSRFVSVRRKLAG
ncbi:MAG: DUF2336 domain-containing protein [Pseudomonadota bacterium]